MDRRFGLILFIAVCICFVVCPGYAELINGGFEISEPNETLGVDLPTGWQTENHASVVDNFISSLLPGRTDGWLIDVNEGLFPFEGQSFVLFDTDNLSQFYSARAWQEVSVSANERISGVYFFGTTDYLTWNDYAKISLIPPPETGLRDIVLARIDVSDVGDFSSTDGWERFEYVFSESEAGSYELELSVRNVDDFRLPSYLAVDDIRICVVPEYGDINHDCEVDLGDFALLSSEWLCDCTDSNSLPDPNRCPWTDLEQGQISVNLISDLDGDMIVDSNDLDKMSLYWLIDPEP